MEDCWDGYPGLCRTGTFGIYTVCTVLPAPIPPSPEPLVPVQGLALVLSGSTALWMVRSQANMYLTELWKSKKCKAQVFEKHSSSTSKGSLICCWSHDQSGAKRVKRGERIKSNLQSCGKQVTYGPSEADHETSPECKYYLICLANVRNPSERILQVRNSSPFFPLLFSVSLNFVSLEIPSNYSR